jgi:glycosyltransferase involved in cell wall biosynthesis
VQASRAVSARDDRPDRRLKLCRIATVPLAFRTFLKEQLRATVASGIDLTLVATPGPELETIARETGASHAGIPIRRQPAPVSDLGSLFRITRFLRRHQFDLVHSTTPKAGLLTALAARIAGVPVRMHTFTGQPWVEMHGIARAVARRGDQVTARLMSQCYADSPSQQDFLVREGIARPGKIKVVGLGSISGVDLRQFSPETWGGARAMQTRQELGIPAGDLVIVFVGRVTKDKGINELLAAFEAIGARDATTHLLLVGPFEPERDPLPPETVDRLQHNRRIHLLGFSATPEKYLAAADIFCLPSYREGFGSSAAEAAAMGLPVIVTRVTGLVDAVVEGVTALMVPPKDTKLLTSALETLLRSPDLRRSLGQTGRERVIRHFDARSVNAAVISEYWRLASGLPQARHEPRPI